MNLDLGELQNRLRSRSSPMDVQPGPVSERTPSPRISPSQFGPPKLPLNVMGELQSQMEKRRRSKIFQDEASVQAEAEGPQSSEIIQTSPVKPQVNPLLGELNQRLQPSQMAEEDAPPKAPPRWKKSKPAPEIPESSGSAPAVPPKPSTAPKPALPPKPVGPNAASLKHTVMPLKIPTTKATDSADGKIPPVPSPISPTLDPVSPNAKCPTPTEASPPGRKMAFMQELNRKLLTGSATKSDKESEKTQAQGKENQGPALTHDVAKHRLHVRPKKTHRLTYAEFRRSRILQENQLEGLEDVNSVPENSDGNHDVSAEKIMNGVISETENLLNHDPGRPELLFSPGSSSEDTSEEQSFVTPPETPTRASESGLNDSTTDLSLSEFGSVSSDLASFGFDGVPEVPLLPGASDLSSVTGGVLGPGSPKLSTSSFTSDLVQGFRTQLSGPDSPNCKDFTFLQDPASSADLQTPTSSPETRTPVPELEVDSFDCSASALDKSSMDTRMTFPDQEHVINVEASTHVADARAPKINVVTSTAETPTFEVDAVSPFAGISKCQVGMAAPVDESCTPCIQVISSTEKTFAREVDFVLPVYEKSSSSVEAFAPVAKTAATEVEPVTPVAETPVPKVEVVSTVVVTPSEAQPVEPISDPPTTELEMFTHTIRDPDSEVHQVATVDETAAPEIEKDASITDMPSPGLNQDGTFLLQQKAGLPQNEASDLELSVPSPVPDLDSISSGCSGSDGDSSSPNSSQRSSRRNKSKAAKRKLQHEIEKFEKSQLERTHSTQLETLSVSEPTSNLEDHQHFSQNCESSSRKDVVEKMQDHGKAAFDQRIPDENENSGSESKKCATNGTDSESRSSEEPQPSCAGCDSDTHTCRRADTEHIKTTEAENGISIEDVDDYVVVEIAKSDESSRSTSK